MLLGSLFLLAYAGGLAELINLGSEWATEAGIAKRVRSVIAGTWVMAIVAWLTVITGTWIVYPWYRAKPPAGIDLSLFPRSLLLSKPSTAEWHKFGMEWKEHVAWLAPILATAVAYMVTRYGTRLAKDDQVRRAVIVLFSGAFFAAAAAGLFGAFINKSRPNPLIGGNCHDESAVGGKKRPHRRRHVGGRNWVFCFGAHDLFGAGQQGHQRFAKWPWWPG